MAIRSGRSAGEWMSHVRLVPTPGGANVRRRVAAVTLAVALPAVGAAGYLSGLHELAAQAKSTEQASPALVAALRGVAEAKMALGLSEARSHELERQIDALNQRLRECQDELTFFRKAGERRH